MEYRVEDNLSYKIHMIKTDKFKTVNVKIIFSKEIKKEKITLRNFSSFIPYSLTSCHVLTFYLFDFYIKSRGASNFA